MRPLSLTLLRPWHVSLASHRNLPFRCRQVGRGSRLGSSAALHLFIVLSLCVGLTKPVLGLLNPSWRTHEQRNLRKTMREGLGWELKRER